MFIFAHARLTDDETRGSYYGVLIEMEEVIRPAYSSSPELLGKHHVIG